ncbi:MAG: hypothetical protein FGM57_01385 [Candidatus Taylorbacteria bacterium]|nr:hypothetical protein [Candidatus Taylorbacteria bacterium]
MITGTIDSVIIICGIFVVLFAFLLRWLQRKEESVALNTQDTNDLQLWWRIKYLFNKVQDLFTDESDERPLETQIESLVRFHVTQLRGDYNRNPGEFLVTGMTTEQESDSRNRLRCLVELVIHLKLMSSDKIQFEKSGKSDTDIKTVSSIIYKTLFDDPTRQLA